MSLVKEINLPYSWSSQSDEAEKVILIEGSSEYLSIERQLSPINVTTIVRVQNPYLYGRFLLKLKEYEMKYGNMSPK